MFSGRGHSSMPCSGDCVLRTEDGGAFPVHRAFLRTASPYFRGLFYDGKTDVLLRGVKGSVLHILLAHEYTDQLCVSNENVAEVLATADMLLLVKCREKCMEMLRRNTHAENCISMAQITKHYYCSPSGDSVTGYVHQHFDKIWRTSEEFQELPVSQLCELLDSPELNVRQEQDVLHAIARWCNAVGDAAVLGQPDFRRLLQCVRVGVCKQAALEEFQNLCPVIANSVAYRETVLEALERGPCLCTSIPFLLDKDATLHTETANGEATEGAGVAEDAAAEGAPVDAADLEAAALPNDAEVADDDAVAVPAEADAEKMDAEEGDVEIADDLAMKPLCKKCGKENPERWLPRLPYTMVFAVGGWSNGQALSDIQAFDPLANRWVRHRNQPGFSARAYHAVAVYGRRVFVIGGMHERKYLRSTMSYDMDSCEWKVEASMHVPRAYVAAVTLGEYIYALGGHTGIERTPSVERYCPRTGQWVVVRRMNRKRSDAAACALKSRLYVCGGFNGERCLDSAEEYTPETDTWSFVRSLPIARNSHRMIKMGDYVYVLGGFDGRRRLTSVVRSVAEPPFKWQSVAHMKRARSTFAVAQLDNELYVIGGYDGKTIVANVERYSPRNNTWMAAPPLREPVSALAACVVTGAPIAKKLSVRGTLLA
ncbi:kelch-like protein 10 [Rhipicephalus microplus]|uniref:kelch-like protein 10 n=1 Tax=Rhipicephalus microplus TaxID=6941 RepID=UPI003F6CF0B7